MNASGLSAILLAAGASTRMGAANKLLLPFGESLMIQQRIEQLQAANIDELIVVIGHEAAEVKMHLPENIRTVINDAYQSGMTSSIQCGVAAMLQADYGIMICQADQVLMQSHDYNHLIDHWRAFAKTDTRCIAVPVFEGQKGNPVIFSSTFREKILAHRAPNGCKAIVEGQQQHLQLIQMPNRHILVDVDTAADYQNYNKSN